MSAASRAAMVIGLGSHNTAPFEYNNPLYAMAGQTALVRRCGGRGAGPVNL